MQNRKILNKKLFVTSRDAASANDLCQVLPSFLTSGNFIIKIAAQEPAYSIIKKKFFHYDIFQLSIELIQSNADAFRAISLLLVKFNPELLLTGISSSIDYGVDEIALQYVSSDINTSNRISTFSIQSYWGDLNMSLGFAADTIFVLDLFARTETLNKLPNCKVIITGSLQDEKYNSVTVLQDEDRFLSKINSKEAKVIGFFGQPLFEYDWYKSTLLTFFKELSALPFPIKVLYKPHPKETSKSIDWTNEAIGNVDKNFVFADKDDVLKSLLKTDIAISLFSTVGYDLQNILARSPIPFSVPLYLFFEKGCKDWFFKYCHLNEIPMTRKSMALVVTESKDISLMICRGLGRDFQSICHDSVKNNISIPTGSASDIVFNEIYSA